MFQPLPGPAGYLGKARRKAGANLSPPLFPDSESGLWPVEICTHMTCVPSSTLALTCAH